MSMRNHGFLHRKSDTWSEEESARGLRRALRVTTFHFVLSLPKRNVRTSSKDTNVFLWARLEVYGAVGFNVRFFSA